MLLGVPILGVALASLVLRRRRRELTLATAGALGATFVLVVALVFAALSSR
jgi:hypothetical protein